MKLITSSQVIETLVENNSDMKVGYRSFKYWNISTKSFLIKE